MKMLIIVCAITLLIVVAADAQRQQDPQFDDGRPRDGQARDVPVFVDIYSHPKTTFSCDDKSAGQYYADPATNCAVYYICLPGQNNKLSATSFACPNGTIFNQATRVCSHYDQVHCNIGTRYYDSVHGHIDSKDKDPQTLSSNSFIGAPSVPWNQYSNVQTRSSRPSQNEQLRAAPQPQQPAVSVAQPTNRRPQALSFRPPTTPRPQVVSSTKDPNVEYEYVDYEVPSNQQPGQNQPGAQPTAAAAAPAKSRKRRSSRRKGTLPSIPLDFLVQPTERIAVLSNFTCSDKIAGLAYADLMNNCTMFHLCLPTETKGKLADHQMFCKQGQAYNQENGTCQEIGSFDCEQSKKFYLYNKLTKEDGRRKWPAQKKYYDKKTPSMKAL